MNSKNGLTTKKNLLILSNFLNPFFVRLFCKLFNKKKIIPEWKTDQFQMTMPFHSPTKKVVDVRNIWCRFAVPNQNLMTPSCVRDHCHYKRFVHGKWRYSYPFHESSLRIIGPDDAYALSNFAKWTPPHSPLCSAEMTETLTIKRNVDLKKNRFHHHHLNLPELWRIPRLCPNFCDLAAS